MPQIAHLRLHVAVGMAQRRVLLLLAQHLLSVLQVGQLAHLPL